jgi:hypothetical protein
MDKNYVCKKNCEKKKNQYLREKKYWKSSIHKNIYSFKKKSIYKKSFLCQKKAYVSKNICQKYSRI